MLCKQLASIPGLEDVTVDGVRPSAQTNGPTVDGSHATGSSTVPPPEVTACHHVCAYMSFYNSLLLILNVLLHSR